MKTIIYKHKKTGIKVIKGISGNYHRLDEVIDSCEIPSDFIEDTDDWKLFEIKPERETYHIFLDVKTDSLFFKNTITGEEFHIGDKVELKPNTSYVDGKRRFKIKSFQISDAITTNKFEYVYIWTEDGKCPPLNDLIKII